MVTMDHEGNAHVGRQLVNELKTMLMATRCLMSDKDICVLSSEVLDRPRHDRRQVLSWEPAIEALISRYP